VNNCQVLLAAHGVAEYASMARKLHSLLSLMQHHPLLAGPHLKFGLSMALKMVRAVIQAHAKLRSAASHEALVMAAMQQLLPRFAANEHVVVAGLVADIFGSSCSSKLPPHKQIYPEKPIYGQVGAIVTAMGLKPNELMNSVVVRVLESFWTENLLFVTGANRSGKSTALQILAPLLALHCAPSTDPSVLARSFLVRQAAGCIAQHSCEAFDAAAGRSTRVSVLKIDPSAMSFQHFMGASDSDGGNDGLFADQWGLLQKDMTSSMVRKYQILLLDGHIPECWIEKILCTIPGILPSSHNLVAPSNAGGVSKEVGAKVDMNGCVKLVLEGPNLQQSTPCWVSFGFVHVPRGCVGPDMIVHRWLQSNRMLYHRQVAKQIATFFPRYSQNLKLILAQHYLKKCRSTN
jgi:hypothetical protein